MFKKLLPLLMLMSCTSAHVIKPEHWPKISAEFTLNGEDKGYTLTEIYQKQPTVLIFWQIGCPCVKRYQERIKSLSEKYPQVAFIYISSNQNESFSESLKEYKKRNEPFLLLRDEHKKLSESLNIKGTPTAVLIDQKGEVKYVGWIDNERMVGEKMRIPYLENALAEFMANMPITAKTSPMFGCPIR
jgi:thiol-disulfide isomerase/thioredoxin